MPTDNEIQAAHPGPEEVAENWEQFYERVKPRRFVPFETATDQQRAYVASVGAQPSTLQQMAAHLNPKRLRINDRVETRQVFDINEGSKIVWQIMQANRYLVLPDKIRIIQQLVAYFCNISEIIIEKTGEAVPAFDLTKGLAIIGNPGSGKTQIMRIMLRFSQVVGPAGTNPKQFAWHSMPGIYTQLLENKEVKLSPYFQDHRLFDDAGSEKPQLSHYGAKFEPLPMILERRYEQFTQHGTLTHLTSNLPPNSGQGVEGFDQRPGFDDRILSRMQEMFTVVVWAGPDLRKGLPSVPGAVQGRPKQNVTPEIPPPGTEPVYDIEPHVAAKCVPCRACKRPIIWLPTKNGKLNPLNAETVHDEDTIFDPSKGHVSHFSDCPNASKFRKL